MKEHPALMLWFVGFSLSCHIALLIWLPDQQWLAGLHRGEVTTGLLVNVIVSEGKDTTTGQESLTTGATPASVTGEGYGHTDNRHKDNVHKNNVHKDKDHEGNVHKGNLNKSSTSKSAMSAGNKGVAPELPAKESVKYQTKAGSTEENSQAASVMERVPESVDSKHAHASGTAKADVRVPGSGLVKVIPQADDTAIAEPALNAPVVAETAVAETVVAEPALDDSAATSRQTALGSGRAQREKQMLTAQSKRYQLGAPQTPKPKYPRIAVQRRWQGEVLIAMQVKADGTPATVTVEKGSGYVVLDNSALRVLANWRLAPSAEALQTLYIPIVFRL